MSSIAYMLQRGTSEQHENAPADPAQQQQQQQQQQLVGPHASMEDPTSTESLPENNGASASVEQQGDAEHQRKRSKVSRACDEVSLALFIQSFTNLAPQCRRKKVKCDATFSPTSNTVVKTCTNCAKTKELCSFERVPLKRGPTKGFVRTDVVIENLHERSKPSSLNSQYQQPIMLPPLTSLAGNVPLRGSTSTGGSVPSPQQQAGLSQPSSPRGSTSLRTDPPANATQGLFIKVPYQGSFERRGSIDSMSSSVSDARSSVSNGGGNFQFAPRGTSYSSSVISDSEDDFSGRSQRNSVDIRARSRSNSGNFPVQPVSPALSLSSLKSFNQGFSQGMTLTNPQHASMQQQNQQAQLIELYYQFIHINFPILPLNRQSLRTLLNIPPPPQQLPQEITEINHFVLHAFYQSLDVLISTTSRSLRSPSSISAASDVQNFLESIKLLFDNWFRVAAKINANVTLFSQNVVILLGMSMVLLCYSVLLLGVPDDLNIKTTVGVFNKLKVFKLIWEKTNVVTNLNYDDYPSILKRLYVCLIVIDSLQSIGFGEPTSLDIGIDVSIVDSLFPNFPNLDQSKNNLILGLKLTQISNLRELAQLPAPTISSPVCNGVKCRLPLFENSLKTGVELDGITTALWDLIISKYQLQIFFEEVIASHTGKLDEELLYDQQLKCLRLTKKHLSIQGILLTSVKNNTNSIDQGNMFVSPFLPLVFKQSVKSLNISKVIINSLQTNTDLVSRLSKQLNEVISLMNYLSLLKPFKLEEMNNHLKFEFQSSHLAWFDNEEKTTEERLQNANHWIGLVTDVYDFLKRDDYDGWY